MATGSQEEVIQIRTSLPHQWAELSEKLSDVVDPEIKYGGGPDAIQTILTSISSLIARIEAQETLLMLLDQARVQAEGHQHTLAGLDRKLTEEEQAFVEAFAKTGAEWLARREGAQGELDDLKEEMASLLGEAIRMDFTEHPHE